MTDHDALLAAVLADPADDTVRLAYADYLEENGETKTAEHYRSLRRPVLDIAVEQLQGDYDWQEVFGEGLGGNCGKDRIDACPPGAAVDLTPPMLADVVEVIAASNGEKDESHWVGLFRLRDGRILLADAWCDYTGWD